MKVIAFTNDSGSSSTTIRSSDEQPQGIEKLSTAPAAATKPRSPVFACLASVTVEPAPFLYAFGIMLYIPVLSYMCMFKLCRQYCGYSIEQCRAFDTGVNKTVDIHVKQVWTEFDGISTILGTIPSIIFALFIGPWSDVFGRKAPIALPFVGTMLAVSVVALLYFVEWLPVWMLMLPTVLQTSCGGMASLLTGAFSYAADVSSLGAADTRTIRITLIEVSVVLGFAIGGIVGGALVGAGIAHFWCYVVSLATAVIGFAYIIVRIRETRRPVRAYSKLELCTSLFRAQNIAASFSSMKAKRTGHARRNLWLLLLALIVNSAMSMGEDNIMQKFLTGAPLHWSLSYFMIFQSASIFFSMLLVICVVGVGKQVLHWQDTTIGIISLLSRILFSYGVAFATVSWIFYASATAGMLRYAAPVAIRALISKLVPKDEQGKIFSLVSTAEAASPIIGTLVSTTIFTVTAQWWPGFFQLVNAYVTIVPLGLIVLVDYTMRRSSRQLPAMNDAK